MKRVVIFLLMVLAARMASAGEVDPEHFGIWAPLGKSCKSEPRIEVSAKEIVIYHQGRVQRFGDLDEFVDCNSGSAVDSIETCVVPNRHDQEIEPFFLAFNAGEKRGRMMMTVRYKHREQFPDDGFIYRRCR